MLHFHYVFFLTKFTSVKQFQAKFNQSKKIEQTSKKSAQYYFIKKDLSWKTVRNHNKIPFLATTKKGTKTKRVKSQNLRDSENPEPNNYTFS